MKRLLALVLGTLVVAGLRMAARQHSSPPEAFIIYHEVVGVTAVEPGSVVVTGSYSTWLDPRHRRQRGHISYSNQAPTDEWFDAGNEYDAIQAGALIGGGLTGAELAQLLARCRSYASGGYPRVAAAELANASGPAEHVRFAGKNALRFVTTDHLFATDNSIAMGSARQTTLWIDANTLLPLQIQAQDDDGTVVTAQYTVAQQLPASTVPSGIFDPPAHQPSLWDRATGWMHEHLPSRR